MRSPSSAKAYAALTLFVFQNSGVYLLMRYSKVAAAGASHNAAYNSAVAVLMQELTKLPLCMLLYAFECGGLLSAAQSIASDLRKQPTVWLKLSLPALLYTVQNNALYLGLTYLEATVAQVTYQCKIFSTALFSICLLGRRLTLRQWFALALLVVGVLFVQGVPEKLRDVDAGRALLSFARKDASGPREKSWAQQQQRRLWSLVTDFLHHSHEESGRFAIGIGAMLLACLCSSFASVYFEMMLKQSDTSLWLRNIQLGLFSTLVALATVGVQDDALIRSDGLLHGFGPLAWAAVIVNAFGGLLVAVTIKYADNILRGFAGGVALIVGTWGSHVLFGFIMTRDYVIGVACVIVAILMYGGSCEGLTTVRPSASDDEDTASRQALISVLDSSTDDSDAEDFPEGMEPRKGGGRRGGFGDGPPTVRFAPGLVTSSTVQ